METPAPRRWSLILLALVFGGSGILHFVIRHSYESIVPDWLPNAPLLVAVSGVAEILGAVGILLPMVRRAAGIGLILLLIAVFPANVHMLMNARSENASMLWQAALWLRLPLQCLLIWWVWWAAVAPSRRMFKHLI